MGFLTRIKRAARELVAPSPGLEDYAAATVRPQEVNTHYGRRQQYQHAQLMEMFAGTVKVAASRNAVGIASNPLKLRRKKQGESAYETRGLRKKDLARVRACAGTHATKAMSEEDDVEDVIDPAHPINLLLSTINPQWDTFALFEATEIGLGLAGNFYWYIAKDATGFPVEIWPLFPQFVHVIPDAENIVSGYVYGRGTEIERTFLADEVIHFKRVNPRGDPYYGAGDLAACVAEAKLGFEFVAMAQAMIDNGVQPGSTFFGPMTPEQRRQLEVSLQAKHSGPHNYGRHIVASVPETVKVNINKTGEQEMAFLASSDRVDQVIANCFDMPVEFLRMKPGGLSGNSDSMHYWQTYGLMPRGRRIEDALNAQLVPLFGDPSLFLCYDPWVKENEAEKGTMIKGVYDSGIITQNEARTELGWDTVEGGDEFKAPAPSPFGDAGGLGGGDAAKPPDANKAKPPEKPEPKSLGPIARIGAASAVVLAAAASGGATPISQKSLLFSPMPHSCCVTHRKDDRLVAVLSATERQLEAALRAWFNSIMGRVVDSVDGDGVGIDLSQNRAVGLGFDQATREILNAIYRSGLLSGVHDVGTKIDPAKLNAALTQGAEQYFREYEGKLIQSVTSTLDERIRTQLADGIAAGEAIPQLRDRIREVMTNASSYTAETIARTESARAYLSARETAWMESGVVTGKRWLLSVDPCEFCEAASKLYNSVPLGQDFVALGASLTGLDGGSMNIDYAGISGPPLHPRCRCSLGAVFDA